MHLLKIQYSVKDFTLVILLFFSFILVVICWAFEMTKGLILASVICFLLGVLFSKSSAIHGLYSLSIISLLALVVYSMALPVHHFYFRDYDEEGVRFVTFMCVVSLVAMITGFQLSASKKHNIKHLKPQVSTSFVIKFGLFVIFLGSFAYILAVQLTVGFSAYIDAGYAGRALVKRHAGPVELGLYYIVLGYLFVLYGVLFNSKKKKNLILCAFLVVFFITYIGFISTLGIRRPSFFMAMSAVLLIFFRVKGNVSFLFMSTTLICLLLFGIFARFRQVLSDHGAIVAVDYFIKNITFEWFDLSSSELGAPFRSMLDVYQPWVENGYQWGLSYIEAVINVLPSAFGLNAPSLSVQYTNEFFSSEYISIGGNMGFFPVAEAYINLGIVGVFIEFVLLGFVIKRIENYAFIYGGAFYSILYAVMAPWFFFFIRTDFSSFIKSFAYSVIPIFVIYYLIKTIFRVNKKISNGRADLA